jgi:peptide deformylase
MTPTTPTTPPQPTLELLTILKYGDPVLRKKGKTVTTVDAKLARTVKAMFDTMYAEPGVGLAAPQVGILLRLMVVDVAPQGKSQPLVLINPKIEETKGRIRSEEGCLSFPGIGVVVPRAEWVKVSAINEKGLPFTVSGDGLLARCLQHEMDHLDGKLMIDHLPLAKRLKVLWDIRRRKKAGLW